MDQKLSKDIEDRKRINETFQRICQLFEQLQNILTTNPTLSPKTILNDLTNICSNLPEQEWFISSHTADIFEYILKSYLELLDIKQFSDVIIQHYPWPSITFIRSVSSSLAESFKTDIMRNMTSRDCQEMYHRLLDQLTSSTTIVSFLKNEFSPSSTNTENGKQRFTSFCGAILIIVLDYLRALDGEFISIEVNKYSDTIFTAFLTFLDQHFMTNQRSQILIKEILRFLIRTSHKTQTIPIFLNVHFPQACLRWLSLSYLSTHEYKYIINILYNIARHDDGAIVLCKLECDKIISQCQTEIADTMIDFILYDDRLFYLHYYMIRILCYDIGEFGIDVAKVFIAHRLLPETSCVGASPCYQNAILNKSQLLMVIVKLCAYDNLIDYILEYGGTPTFFARILIDFLYHSENTKLNYLWDMLKVMILVNIIWSISFHDRYKNDLINNTEFMKRLEVIHATSINDNVFLRIYISRCISSLRRAIDGIYHNLYLPKPYVTSINHQLLPSIMISYSYDDIHSCRQLFDLLSKLPQLSVSVDFINGKHLWKETAQTIEQSDLILFLISKKFYISKSCRQEFLYVTQTLNKMFVAVYLDGDYEADEWLKSGLAGSKSIRCERTDLPNTYDGLLTTINECLSINILPVSLLEHSFNVKQWDDNNVQQWFKSNNITLELYDFYQFDNGNELLSFAQAMIGHPWTKEYERIKRRLEEKSEKEDQHLSSYEFSKFINALERLNNKHISST